MGSIRGKYKIKEENLIKLKAYINGNIDKYQDIYQNLLKKTIK